MNQTVLEPLQRGVLSGFKTNGENLFPVQWIIFEYCIPFRDGSRTMNFRIQNTIGIFTAFLIFQ